MSVPIGALSAENRVAILGFYGEALGWREMDGVSNAERLTIWVGRDCYINLREREFGVRVRSAEDLDAVWSRVSELGADPTAIESEADVPMFRFHHLLPMSIEVQYFPS